MIFFASSSGTASLSSSCALPGAAGAGAGHEPELAALRSDGDTISAKNFVFGACFADPAPFGLRDAPALEMIVGFCQVHVLCSRSDFSQRGPIKAVWPQAGSQLRSGQMLARGTRSQGPA
jgi:hypothetical protein